jgi:hypothetical protein
MSRPPHPPRRYNSNYTWWSVQIMKLLVMQLSPLSRHSIPLWSKYSPQHPVLKHTQDTVYRQRKRRTDLKVKGLYSLIGKSPASLESKVLLYKTIIKPIWTYGIELWGCASKSHIAKMQRSQSKILRMITYAPWYVTNQTLHDDLKVSFIKNVIQEKSINQHD